MRKLVVALTIVGSLLPVGQVPPASAHFGDHKINFPVAETIPCSFFAADVCPYNTPAEELGYQACSNPFPPGSWFDIVTEPAPTPPPGKKMLLEFEIFPQIDWDSFICAIRSDGTNGAEVGRGANILGQPCDNLLGTDNVVPIGCEEKAVTVAEPGKRYILRAYNYSDIADCPGVYRWVAI